MTATVTAKRRHLQFEKFDQVIEDVQRLCDSGYSRLGQWTLSQVCDHLAIFFRGSLDGFGYRAPWLFRVVLGKPILRSIMRKGFRAGIKVPRRFLPGDPRADALAADTFVALVRRFDQHCGEYQPSPVFGQLSRDQWRRLHLLHAAHHLSFLVPNSLLDHRPMLP